MIELIRRSVSVLNAGFLKRMMNRSVIKDLIFGIFTKSTKRGATFAGISGFPNTSFKTTSLALSLNYLSY